MSRFVWADERGSLPLTLIVAIIVGGIVAVLFGVVRTGIDTSGRDRDFAAAIQIADAGLQDAYLELLAIDEDSLNVPLTPVDCIRPLEILEANTIEAGVCMSPGGFFDDGGFVYEYERIGDSRNWRVSSWGAYRDNIRLVTSTTGEQSLFRTALLARETLRLNALGGSAAGGVCNLENPFAVGAGGSIQFTGFSGACVNGVLVFTESRSLASGSDLGVFSEDAVSYELPEVLDETMVNFAAEAFAAGECSGASLDSMPEIIEYGQTYCVNSTISLSKDDPVVVSGDETQGEATIFINGDLFFNSQAEVNVEGDAGDLLFSISGSEMTIQSNAEVKAGIWAPAAVCESNGGSGFFEGAMTCNRITVNGNWRYDPSVTGIGGSEFGIRDWNERPPRGGPPAPIALE